MPHYTYKFIDTDETVTVYQPMSDDALTEMAHPKSGKIMDVKKIFSAPTIKGKANVPATESHVNNPTRSSLWNSAQQS
jgi:predicted nucleic acid-binding Zn ribbon protein